MWNVKEVVQSENTETKCGQAWCGIQAGKNGGAPLQGSLCAAASPLPPLLLRRSQLVLVFLQHELGLVPRQPAAGAVCTTAGRGV